MYIKNTLVNFRKTVTEINLSNLYDNYNNVSKRVGNKTVIPVVKANAYGHGSVEVTRHLHENGVDYFAVSLLEEALELRNEFHDIDILVMGVVDKEDFNTASKYNITVTIESFDQLEDIVLNQQLKVHINVDTGMNRLGFKTDADIVTACELLCKNKMYYVEGIYTHFSTADDNEEYYMKQLNRFKVILSLIDKKFDMVHISNSSSSLKYEKDYDFTTHTRLGISLYGLTLDKGMDFLKNTYTLKTKLSSITKIRAGEKVGYGATYTALTDELIGVLPIGYADGFIRQNNPGDVEINGKRFPIVGRICMDQMFIRIDDSITKENDVILFGNEVSIDEVADRLRTINYEVICQITYRVPKVYIK
jgi:alanine racemase